MMMLAAVVTAKKIASLRMKARRSAATNSACSARFDAPPGKEDPERDQYQAQDEDNWDENKDQNADVWVAGVASKLDGQNEQPGEPSGGHQRDAQHADPVTEEQYEYGAFWIVAHSFFTLPARNSGQTSLPKMFGTLATFVRQVELARTSVPHR